MSVINSRASAPVKRMGYTISGNVSTSSRQPEVFLVNPLPAFTILQHSMDEKKKIVVFFIDKRRRVSRDQFVGLDFKASPLR
jgi:hypothetical protein